MPAVLSWEDASDDEVSEGSSKVSSEGTCEEEQRVDPADGREYCRREFEECYGGIVEWEAAKPLEEVGWGCAYCGTADVASCMQCTATGRWFCNSTAGTNGTSHAVLHLILSGHKTLAMHPNSPVSSTPLECHNCGCNNLLILGYVPHVDDPDASVLLCREPCLHTCTSAELGPREEWTPLIVDKCLQSWLACDPKTRAIHNPQLPEIKALEEAWKAGQDATVTSVTTHGRRGVSEGLPLHYGNGDHYRSAFTPLLKIEADADRAASENCTLEKLDVTWHSPDKATFTFFRGDANVKLTPLDQVTLKPLSPPGPLITMKVVSIGETTSGGLRVTLEKKSSKDKGGATGQYTLGIIWNATPFTRTQHALDVFATQDDACGEDVYRSLLGHGSLEAEAAAGYELPRSLQVPGVPELNYSQSNAVGNALRQAVSLIQGPPGTGKTTTSSVVAYHLVKKHRLLLACTPSNTAADHLATAIAKTGVKVVRLLSRTKELDNQTVCQASGLTLSQQLKDVVSSAPRDSTLAVLERRRTQGQGLDAADAAKLGRHLSRIEAELLETAEVVVTTCINAGDHRLGRRKFPAVLIDEATQATEPETLIPITQGCQQLVLIGDHCQLGPVVVSDQAKFGGLSQSLFERMVHLGTVPERLVVQYRMHPALSQWPSGAFYDGALQNGVAESDRPPNPLIPFIRPDTPVMMLHHSAHEELAPSGTSFVNRAEAITVEQAVSTFLKAGILPEAIGVVTPYDGQRNVLRAMLGRCEAAGADLVEVASVDSFQGREKDYIVLTCVRSNEGQGIGFLTDPKRLNVALTRARRGLIIVGNATSLGRSHLWHGLLQHLRDLNVICEGAPVAGRLRISGVVIPEPAANPRPSKATGWVAAPPVSDTSYDLISQPEYDFSQSNLSSVGTSTFGPPSLVSVAPSVYSHSQW